MTQYRKRPVVVDAVQWTGRNTREVREFIATHRPSATHAIFVPRRGSQMTETLFSNLIENAGPEVTAALWVEANTDWLGIENTEWILVDSMGFYPCKNQIFVASYERVEGES